MEANVLTSESVSDGHPDKIADQISDAVLDEALRVAGDKSDQVRCACETLVKGDNLIIAGELTTAPPEVKLAKDRLREIAQEVVLQRVGYDEASLGFDVEKWNYLNFLTPQAAEIEEKVSKDDLGAGDQGLMFGCAVDETPELMPLAISLSHALMRQQKAKRQELPLGPDAKAQATIEYAGGKTYIKKIVVSTQHASGVSADEVRQIVAEHVVQPVLAECREDLANHPTCQLDASEPELLLNHFGSFKEGGPKADAGLTGRKIIVDTYGGAAPHGGGAFSGKDPTKVDRSAAYMARYIAKTVVRHKLVPCCMIQLAYVIGDPQPLSVMVKANREGGADISNEICTAVRERLDLSVSGIIKKFNLFSPNGWSYLDTAAFGHFGRAEFPWENPVENCAFDSWCREQAPA